MTADEHLPKHPICIVPTLIGTFRVLIVHPGQHDHFARRVVAKKQAVLLEKLGPKAVFVVFAERVALSVLWPRRVLLDDIEVQFDDCRPCSNRERNLGQP